MNLCREILSGTIGVEAGRCGLPGGFITYGIQKHTISVKPNGSLGPISQYFLNSSCFSRFCYVSKPRTWRPSMRYSRQRRIERPIFRLYEVNGRNGCRKFLKIARF